MGRWRLLAASGVMLLAATRAEPPASAESTQLWVGNTADAGRGSLRDAILRANAQRGRKTIRFDSINGPFATPQTIALRSELPPLEGELTIDGYIEGRLWQPTGVTVSGAKAHRVIEVKPGARAILSSITVADGRAERGGAVLNRGTLILKGVTFRANSAAREGGAVATEGSLTAINSTFAENEAGDRGGGLAVIAGTATITNCTFAGNQARAGGGLFTRPAILLRNTLLAHGKKSDCTAVAGVDPRSTHNLIMTNEGCGKPILSVDPKLEKLGLYSGPTATMPLSGGSSAINLGDNASAVDDEGKPLVWDQRGNGDPRFVAGFTDIGAFEVQAFPVLRVNTPEDNGLRACSGVMLGDCSLRGALELANAAGKRAVVSFDPRVFASTRTLTISRRLPDPTVDVTLDGRDAGGITIRAASHALRAKGGGRLSLQGVTIADR